MIEVRLDSADVPKIKKTKDGYIKLSKVKVGKTGVLPYVNNDGTMRYELRHPDDVLLDQESLDSLKMVPLTVGHPNVLVNADNAEFLSVGGSCNNPTHDGKYLIADLICTHKKGIKAIENQNIRQVSLAYTLDRIEESGFYEGQYYTHRQKNVRYNHIALVFKGRAGPDVAINFDSADDVCVYMSAVNVDSEENNIINTDLIMNENDLKELEAITQDFENVSDLSKKGEDNNESEDIKKSLDEIKKKISDLEKRVSEKKVETEEGGDANAPSSDDSEKGAASHNEDSAINLDEAIESKVKEEVERTLQVAMKAINVINLDSLCGKSRRQIMEEVIKSDKPDFDAKSKDDSYVEARFDSIIENTPKYDFIKRQIGTIESSYVNNDAEEPKKLSISEIMKKQYENHKQKNR